MPRRPVDRKKLNPKDRVTAEGRILTQTYDRLWPTTADRLHFFRKALGVSQREFSEECELSSSVISRIECGYGLPMGKSLIKLGKGLGISSDYLLGMSSRKDIER